MFVYTRETLFFRPFFLKRERRELKLRGKNVIYTITILVQKWRNQLKSFDLMCLIFCS